MSVNLYPLLLEPILKEKVWGGEAVYSLLHRAPTGAGAVGEAWIVFGENRIAAGPLQGRTLDEVIAQDPGGVLGEELARRGLRQCPLLAKFLDAHENLSVQVHPDDAYAQTHEGVPFGKAEFWYILDTEPGARIIHGPARELERAALARDLANGTIDPLQWVAVAPGDVVLNLPGMIHATGAGIVLYELQQSSDVTYRLYDWDRGDVGGQKRELHLDRGLDVADLHPPRHHLITPLSIETNGVGREILCACHYFAADLVRFDASSSEEFALPSFHAWTVLDGSLRITQEQTWEFGPGTSFVLPAALHHYTISAPSGPARAIRAYVPNLQRDVIAPLEARGYTRAQITQLAGERGAAQFG